MRASEEIATLEQVRDRRGLDRSGSRVTGVFDGPLKRFDELEICEIHVGKVYQAEGNLDRLFVSNRDGFDDSIETPKHEPYSFNMHARYILKLLPLAILTPVMMVGYVNCSEFAPDQQTMESASSLSGCATVAAALQEPKSIAGAIDLINALPKPVSIDCFISNLKKPLGVFAVNNAFSAQPSAGPKSPRILIISYPLVLSVVPAGTGRFLLEMSELVDSRQSIKAEIQFPVAGDIVTADAFDHLVNAGGGTDCRVCHQNESPAGGSYPASAMRSDILRPDSFYRVSATTLQREATICNPAVELYRCRMLQSIFIVGRARDVAFP